MTNRSMFLLIAFIRLHSLNVNETRGYTILKGKG
nr:MAG TPA: hypothetical protein [Caudoviricetes sp.]